MATVRRPEQRIYNRQDCITFRKTAERFGGLSNMAGGYPLLVNSVKILTSEALYQACRFPHIPEVQQLIIAERSPMTAKMKSKPHRDNSRPDWDIVRTKIMRWCLQVKLIQNWGKFSKLLLETGDLPIVEDSRKDNFWGAKPEDETILVGINVLGRLLMQLREQIKNGEIHSATIINPLPINDFLLYGGEINPISAIGDLLNISNVSLNNEEAIVTSTLESNFSNDLVEHDSTLNRESSLNNEDGSILVAVTNETGRRDAFYKVLPDIIEELQIAPRTDKELAEVFNINSSKQMRDWLERAVKLGKVKKLSKPVRYIAEHQLSLLN